MRDAISGPEAEDLARKLSLGESWEDLCKARGLDPVALEAGGWTAWCFKTAGLELPGEAPELETPEVEEKPKGKRGRK